MLDRHITRQDQIITKYEKLDINNQQLDSNNQRIDFLATKNEKLYEDQHRDDKQTIGQLQDDLSSCRSNQKWIFGAGGLIGGVVGYKIRGAGTLQNPFQPSVNFMTMPRSQTEENLQKALKKFNQ